MSWRDPAKHPGLAFLLLACGLLTISGPGCSSEGVGSVNVKNPSAVRARLEKGTKSVAPTKGATDDMGAKFRKGGD